MVLRCDPWWLNGLGKREFPGQVRSQSGDRERGKGNSFSQSQEIDGTDGRPYSRFRKGLCDRNGRPAMLAATLAVFGPFDGTLSTRAEQIGALGGNTMSKNEVLQLFRTKIRQRQGRVTDVFGESSAEVRESFPQGLSYFTKATKQTIKPLLGLCGGEVYEIRGPARDAVAGGVHRSADKFQRSPRRAGGRQGDGEPGAWRGEVHADGTGTAIDG